MNGEQGAVLQEEFHATHYEKKRSYTTIVCVYPNKHHHHLGS